MENFGPPKKQGVWEGDGDNIQEATDVSTQESRAEELLAGQDWSIAPEVKIMKSDTDRRPVDPMELSSTQMSAAEALLSETNFSVAEIESSSNNYNKGPKLTLGQDPVDPMELTPNKLQAAETILANNTTNNSELLNKPLTSIPTIQPLKQAQYDTSARVPFENNGLDRVGKNCLSANTLRTTTPAPTLFSKIKNFFN
jgi:hypothetical protein